MTNLNQSLLLRALRREPVERTPVWLMRQAGRYLPEYRATRAEAQGFLSLCKRKELACEVALQPLRRFALDAAILFSDILTIPDAMNLGLYFAEGEGPRFKYPLHSFAAIENLAMPEAGALSYVMDAVQLIRQEMPADLPLIGFSGSPWTLSCYMVEGQSSASFQRMQNLIQVKPELALLLLDKLVVAITDYLRRQADAGANVLMIFDTWGGLLTRDNYLKYSLQPIEKIVQALQTSHPELPLILFTKGGGAWLKEMAQTGCQALGLDWNCDLGKARALVGEQVALQGNLNPAILLSEPAVIRDAVQQVLCAYGPGSGHVFNLGHGITPEVPVEHVQVMVDAVHEFSPQFHRSSS